MVSFPFHQTTCTWDMGAVILSGITSFATASMPLWLKAAALLKEETESNTALADVAFYLGYGEGGYASVAMAEGLKNGIGVKPLRVIAGAGPFRMKDGTNLKTTVASAHSCWRLLPWASRD
jgi:hypothetical protein